MPRPPKSRRVGFLPHVTYFKPAAVPMRYLKEVRLSVDELEALRLKDVESLQQEEAAGRMGIAQSTYQRILTTARRKLTEAIVKGRALRIEGGTFRIAARHLTCRRCGNRWTLDAPPPPGFVPACPICGTPVAGPLGPGRRGGGVHPWAGRSPRRGGRGKGPGGGWA